MKWSVGGHDSEGFYRDVSHNTLNTNNGIHNT